MAAPGTRLVKLEPPAEEFMKLLRASPERLDLVVRKRFRELSASVRGDARAAAEAAHPTPHGERKKHEGGQHWRDLVASIRSGSTSASPYIAIGTANVPWALGFEFGGGKRPRTRQFPPWRGKGDSAGYFFWPTVRAAADRVGDGMVTAIDEALREAFPE